MSRFFRKAAKAAKKKLVEKAKKREEWNKVKAKIHREERIKHEKLLERQKLTNERRKAKERLETGSPLKRVLISGLKATGKIVKEELSSPEKKKKKK